MKASAPARAGVVVLVLAACGEREHDRPDPKLVLDSPRPARIELSPELGVLADGVEAAMAARTQHDAEIRVALRWLESVRHGVPANDRVLELPLVSVLPRCADATPCARTRIDALMSIAPQLTPNIVAPDLISYVYHSSDFARLEGATYVDVSVFGDLGSLGLDSAAIRFAIGRDAHGALAIEGIEIQTMPLDTSR